MKNVVGAPPTGKDFFPRPAIEEEIYFALENDSNIYLSAPRRMGKTAIMQHLRDEPRKGYLFIFLSVESVHEARVYLETLLEHLEQFQTYLQAGQDLIKTFLGKVKKFSASGIELAQVEKTDVELFNEYKTIIPKLKTKDNKIILMVDEFPQAVVNIERKEGKDKAIQFLQFNREIRQLQNHNIRYIFTGSVGLASIAMRLGSSHQINDLDTVVVNPFSIAEGTALLEALFAHNKVQYAPDVIPTALAQIQYLAPFYIQILARQMMMDFRTTKTQLTSENVTKAWKIAIDARNDSYFERYFSRLQDAFDAQTLPFVKDILKQIAKKTPLALSDIETIAQTHNINDCVVVLRELEYSGYLFYMEQEEKYDFTAPMLKAWWAQFVR
jgi:hypothetical protein